jgi:HEAT repeats
VPGLPAHAAGAKPAPRNWTGLIMTALVVTSTIGGIAYSLGYGRGRNKATIENTPPPVQLKPPTDPLRVIPEVMSAEAIGEQSEKSEPGQLVKEMPSGMAIDGTSRLAKVDIVEELIQDLLNPDPAKRRKAIWDLGQQGDSRAVQPLVELMMDSDSSQRSLILSAISEIGIKTLKPVNRALMLSLQDNSSDVRKNGIRDVTRIYDLIGQISQLLQHAASDPDQEVQETATWALAQLNRIRPLGGVDAPSLPSGLSFKELESAGVGAVQHETGSEG